MALLVVGRAAVYTDLIVGFQYKLSAAIGNQAILEGESIHLTHIAGGHHTGSVLLSAGYIHTGGGSTVLQASGHDNEVFNGSILGKRIRTRFFDHTGDGHGTLVLEVIAAGDIQFIIVLEHEIRLLTGHDVRQVQGEYFHGFVGMLAMNHHAIRKGFRQQAAGFLHKSLGGTDLTQFISTGEIHEAMDGNTVLKTGLDFTHLDSVSRYKGERGIILILNRANLKGLVTLAKYGNGGGVGPVGETSCILKKLIQILPFLHFKVHGALDGTLDGNQALVGRDQDNIALFQADIIVEVTLHQELIDVHPGHYLPVTYHLDVTDGARFHHSACTIQGVEGRGKGRQHIGAGVGNFSHYVNLDGSDLAQAQAHIRAFPSQATVNLAQSLFQVFVGFVNGHSAQINRTQHIHIDAAFRRNDASKRGLVAAEDVDDDLIAGAQPVVAGSGQILARRKIQRFVTENITAINRSILRHERVHLLVIGNGTIDRMGTVHILGCRLCLVGRGAGLVKRIYTLSLGPVNTFQRELSGNIVTIFSLGHGLLDIFQHLFIRH